MTGSIDLVVVGAGIAGLVAANRAAELGRRVVVIEKGEGIYACNSRIATGALNVAHHDPHSDPAVLRKAIEADTEGYADPALADVLAVTAGRSLQWLRAEGVEIVAAPRMGKQRWVLAPPRELCAGLDWEGRGPDVVLQRLTANLKQRGAELRLGTRATRLIMDGNRCLGIVAEQSGKEVTFRSANTLLADGGFQGNAALVHRFISPRPEALTQRNAGTGQGDALLMAEAAGARITDADAFYGHLLSRDSLRKASLWPYPTMDTLVGGAIMIDRSGRRFLDEGLGGIALSNAIARMDDPLKATAVFDHAIWETAGRAEIVPANPALVEAGGTLHSAPDLRSLATMIDVPADALQDTVAIYNRAIADGRAAQLSPPRSSGRMFGQPRATGRRVEVRPVAQPPFYAVPLAVGLTYTMGGIAIDEHARVIGKDGMPMPGLYAAGSCTGGVEGGPFGGYIGGYLKSVGLGLIAGEEAGRNV